MRRSTNIIGLIFLGLAVQAPVAVAQKVIPPQPPDLLENANANQTKDQLNRLLQQAPPTLTRVLQTDPELLTNKEYLAPYPLLWAFVGKHPEIGHNSAYFLGSPNNNYYQPRGSDRVPAEIAQYLAVASVMISVVVGITWIIRSVIEYRRWLRIIKSQSEFHSRLMDRLTSSEDLLGYIQSPAGRRFLEAAPALTEGGTPGGTLGRILWSVQAGLVMGLAGIGLSYSSNHINTQASEPFFVLGILAMAIGGGFILSAFASYTIARHMGLVRGTSETPPT